MLNIIKKREILLVDRDTGISRLVANVLRNDGYRVETTDSAVHALSAVLEKLIPVVLLGGSDIDRTMNLPDLVRLLRKCNRQLNIILFSNGVSLPLIRTIRQAGIFYHALKPADPDDTAEIRLAVECAFANVERSALEGGREIIPRHVRF